MLDNVVDINYYPTVESKNANQEPESVEHGNLRQQAVRTPDARIAGRTHVSTGVGDDHRKEGRFSGAVAGRPVATLPLPADHERGIAEQGAVTDLDGEGRSRRSSEVGDRATTGPDVPGACRGSADVINHAQFSHTDQGSRRGFWLSPRDQEITAGWGSRVVDVVEPAGGQRTRRGPLV